MNQKRAYNFKDITGKKYGLLTVIKFIGNKEYFSAEGIKKGITQKPWKKKRSLWLCKCDCGKEKVVMGYSLTTGNICSCGCIRKTRLLAINKHKRLEPGLSAMRKLIKSYVSGAKKRNLSWTLTESEFKELTSKECHYCGTPPYQTVKGYYTNYTYNGIDRINNNLGYEINNCVPCCGPCNLMKMDMDKNSFINLCKKIYLKSINQENYKTIVVDRKKLKERNHYNQKKFMKN